MGPHGVAPNHLKMPVEYGANGSIAKSVFPRRENSNPETGTVPQDKCLESQEQSGSDKRDGYQMKKYLLFAALGTCLLSGHAMAMTDAECTAAFKAADKDGNGVLSETEASQYFAAMRVGNHPMAGNTMSQADFMTNCKADIYRVAAPEAGAPLAGANSFTEGQAKDRAMAAGYTAVSELKKDDKGIWRGTASQNAKQVNIAVDYKGNVVAN